MNVVKNRFGMSSGLKVLAVMMISTGTYAAPVAVIDSSSNRLTGINAIEIAGYGTWDVTFNNVWQGDIYSIDFAIQATTAIHDIFSPGGFLSGSVYDVTPFQNIEACNNSNNCDTFTAYDDTHANDSNPYLRGYFWRNFTGDYAAAESPETATVFMQGIKTTLSERSLIHASWDNSQYVSSVPVPAAVWLFGSGLLTLLGVSRRKV